MSTPLLNARVAPDVVAELDALAQREGVTRSDLVRRALTELLADPARVLGHDTDEAPDR